MVTALWDNFCNEPITALLTPVSGLLTENSHKGRGGAAVTYPWVDAILVCRYHHQLLRSTRNEPMIDDEPSPFLDHHTGFPPKALVANPHGRPLPEGLLVALDATMLAECLGTEYIPGDPVMWVGEDEEQPES
jgi:hypothetical protein